MFTGIYIDFFIFIYFTTHLGIAYSILELMKLKETINQSNFGMGGINTIFLQQYVAFTWMFTFLHFVVLIPALTVAQASLPALQ